MNKKLKIILLLLVVFIIVGGSIGIYMWNKPHRNVKDATAVKISAAELYNSFINDSAEAKTLYLNKVLEASGEISGLSKNQKDQMLVFLKTGVQDGFINCTMEGDIKNIKPGDKIAIKGICNGLNGDADMGIPRDLVLDRCYISTN